MDLQKMYWAKQGFRAESLLELREQDTSHYFKTKQNFTETL